MKRIIMILLALLINASVLSGPSSQSPHRYKKHEQKKSKKQKQNTPKVASRKSSTFQIYEELPSAQEAQPAVEPIQEFEIVQENHPLPINSPADISLDLNTCAHIPEQFEKEQENDTGNSVWNYACSCLSRRNKSIDKILQRYKRRVSNAASHTPESQIIIYQAAESNNPANRLILIGDERWIAAINQVIEQVRLAQSTFLKEIQKLKAVQSAPAQPLLLTYPVEKVEDVQAATVNGVSENYNTEDIKSTLANLTAERMMVLQDQIPSNKIIVMGDAMWLQALIDKALEINPSLVKQLTRQAASDKLLSLTYNPDTVENQPVVTNENPEKNTPTGLFKSRALLASGVSVAFAAVAGVVYKCINYLKADKDSDATAWQKIKNGVQADTKTISDNVFAAKDASVKFLSDTSDKVRTKARAAASAVATYYNKLKQS